MKKDLKMLKKRILVLLVLVAMGAVVLGPTVLAADTANVTATVMVQNVAVSVSPGTIDYGTLTAGGVKSTLPGEANAAQTVTNDGNVSEDFNIAGADVSTGCSWTLAETQDSEQYFHKFCNDTDNDCDTPPTNYTALTTGYQTLDTGIETSNTVDFHLQIGVPSSTTCTDQATVTVTVQAVASSFLAVLVFPFSVYARLGVGVATGKIVVDDKLKPGMIYNLPTLTVLNTGDEEAEYEVGISYHEDQSELRPKKEWFEFSPQKFFLKPGEGQKIEVKLNLPIKAEPGDYFAYLEGTVLPANMILGVYYKAASLWRIYQPWSFRIAIVLGAVITYLFLNKYLGFQIGFRKKEKEKLDE